MAVGLLALAGLSSAGAADNGCGVAAQEILLRVEGVRNDRGHVVAVLYGDSPQDFLKSGKRLRRQRVLARPGSVELCVVPPGAGVYALAVFHDEDDNLRFGQSWLGLPAEGYGFSNNPQPMLGAPSHAEAAFRVGTGSMALNIRLRY